MVNDIDSLENIANEISQCKNCRLGKDRINVVPGEGDSNAKIVFVGEAPGRKEDETGRPFVGAAGKILDKWINQLGLERKDVFITSVIKCRPPENRDPKPDEKKACMPHLEKQLKTIQPKAVVALGRHALASLTGEVDIKAWHGKTVKENIFSLYHPAAVIYNRRLQTDVDQDLKNLKEIVENNS